MQSKRFIFYRVLLNYKGFEEAVAKGPLLGQPVQGIGAKRIAYNFHRSPNGRE